MLVVAVVAGGCIARDGRIVPGDYLLSVNNESLRNVTNSQARAILRRTQLLSTDISVNYIPGEAAAAYRKSLQDTEPPAGLAAPRKQSIQISPSSPYIPQDNKVCVAGVTIESSDDTPLPPPPTIEPVESEQELVPLPESEPEQEPEPEPEVELELELEQEIKPELEKEPEPELVPKIEPEPEPEPEPRSVVSVPSSSRDSIDELSALPSRPVTPPTKLEMTVTQGHAGSASSPSSVLLAKHWGPERLVEILREPNCSLGISIVGGKVDLYNAGPDSGSAISGIFIKNVLPQSPAGRTGELKTGDRILEVDGVDLRQASHERAVEVIRGAGNPVCFLVQSLIQWSVDADVESHTSSAGAAAASGQPAATSPTPSGELLKVTPAPVPQARTPTPELVQEGSTEGRPARSPPKYSSDESDEDDEEEDVRFLEGRIYTKKGQEIHRASAGNVKRSKEEIEADPEEEDEFGYTASK
ncbi:hypothetical protein C0J52_03469 [Blattella germanica]|nr:hypothetical protein C0J52_03469 [Blattella germanica]